MELCTGPGLAGWDTWEVEEAASARWEKLQFIAKLWAVLYIDYLTPSPQPGRSAGVARLNLREFKELTKGHTANKK